jgi:two-component system, chemotaxis family, sensor kinase CheA
MPVVMNRAASIPRLRERVDELATGLALSGATIGLTQDAIKVCEQAKKAGFSEADAVHARLTDAVGTELAQPALEELLSSEIMQLQQMLEADGVQQTTPPTPAKVEKEERQEKPKKQSKQEKQNKQEKQERQDKQEKQEEKNHPEPSSLSLIEDPELAADFIVESREHLNAIEQHMLRLEQNAADMDVIHAVFRGFHTIKGLAGFLAFNDIQEVAHEIETLLDLARNSKLAITPAIVDVVLEGADFLKQALTGVEEALASKSARAVSEWAGLVEKIRAAAAGDVKSSDAPVQAAPAQPTPSQPAPQPAAQMPAQPAVQAPAQTAAQLPVQPSPEPPPTPSVEPTGESAPSTPAAESKAPKAKEVFSIRVDTEKLDHLMDMVGEMVIAQSLVRHNHNLGGTTDSRLQRDLSQLARITIDVQRTTMSLRMLPIGQLFQRTVRLVRDLSRRAGKQVELEMSGEETEVDKTIAEELADPLMHMIRNSLDHGIELPEARAAAGKNPTARVRLAAYHQGGQIVVEISDDGRGLDKEKIVKKARENGLITEDAQLTETEIFHLIFEPGFSTAEKVTDISGRGVGMDVVRGRIQKLRGRIEIQSKPGCGTTFYLKLPLTLAIIEGLVVLVGSNRYIVPIFAVREMFRPTPEMLSTVGGKNEMVTVRGRLLPIVRLHRRFRVEPRSENLCESLLVVVESQERQFCLLVDDLAGKQEVVIKSLGDDLKNVQGVAGGAILGDGRVGLILDMDGVFPGGQR